MMAQWKFRFAVLQRAIQMFDHILKRWAENEEILIKNFPNETITNILKVQENIKTSD